LGDETKDPTENQTVTKEEYDAIKLELEAEKVKTQEAVEQAIKPFQEWKTALENTVAGQQTELNTKVEELEGAKAAYAYALEDFKKLAASSNPLIPPEVIFGTTVEEVKASLERANKLVANVQESLAKQAAAAVVPAGAPARGPASTEGLSTKEKITLGLEQAKKKKEQ
jgi:hypothetical protein